MKKLSLEHTIRNIQEFSVTGPNSGVYTPGVSRRPTPGERNYEIAPFEKDQPARLQKQIDQNVERLKPPTAQTAEEPEKPKVSTGKANPSGVGVSQSAKDAINATRKKKKEAEQPVEESLRAMSKISLEHTIRNIVELAASDAKVILKDLGREVAPEVKAEIRANRAKKKSTTGFEPDELPAPDVKPSEQPIVEPAPAKPNVPEPQRRPATPAPAEPVPVPAPAPQRQPATPAPTPQRTPAPAHPAPMPKVPAPTPTTPGKPSTPLTQPQVKPEVQPQVEPQTKPDTKTKTQTQTQTQTKVQPQTKTQTQTKTKAEVKTPVKTAVKPPLMPLLPFGSGSDTPPGAPLDAGTTAIGTSTGIARRRMSFDDAPSLKAVAKQITKKRAMRAEGYVQKSQTLGETVKRVIKDKKDETGAGKNPLVNTDVNLKRPDLSEEGWLKDKINSGLDKAATWWAPKQDALDDAIGKVADPIAKAVPDSVKSTLSSGAKKVNDFFDKNKNLPSSDEIAKNLAQKKTNFANLSPAQQRMVPSSVRRSLGNATPENTENRLRGAANVADVASYAVPGLGATRFATDAYTNAEKGKYTDAALDTLGMGKGKVAVGAVATQVAKSPLDIPDDDEDTPKKPQK